MLHESLSNEELAQAEQVVANGKSVTYKMSVKVLNVSCVAPGNNDASH